MKSEIPCVICGCKSAKIIEYKNTWAMIFENKTVTVCDACGFGRIWPKIETEALKTFYQDTYRSVSSPHYVDFSKQIPSKPTACHRACAQLSLGRQFLASKDHYNFLDIGSGLGKSFIVAKSIFAGRVRTFSIEEDIEVKKYYSKHFKEVVVLSSLNEVDVPIDILLMSHSLEHFDFDDMAQLFKQAQEVLADDGIIIIEVPNADFRDVVYLQGRQKDVPHCSFFSSDSLKMLLKNFGFHICFLSTSGISIEEMFVTQKTNESSGSCSVMRSWLRATSIYKNLSRVKKVFCDLSRSMSNKDFLLTDSNFRYTGNRAVLRCVIKKNTSKVQVE